MRLAADRVIVRPLLARSSPAAPGAECPLLSEVDVP